MRAALVRGYLLLRHRDLLGRLRALEASQWLTPEAIRRIQTQKLRRLLDHAGRTVPYYREVFRQTGFDPRALRSPEDLEGLPVLDRETLIRRHDDLISEDPPGRVVHRSTGGSTGRPLRFAVDLAEMTTRSANIYRNLRWLGWDLGARTAYVWGSDIDSKEHSGWRAALRDTVLGTLWLDAFAMQDRRLDGYLDRIESHRPTVLIGYPSSLHVLAERALVTGRRLPVGGVQTSAEMLAPRAREEIGRAFGAPVLDRYGCREAGVIAHECPEGHYHVNAESVVLETAGEEVLVTTLENLSMPLVRYRNEDLARLRGGRCPCGRGLPTIEAIRGRLSDVIRSPGGRLIHGEFFTHLFYDVEGVSRFQVRQTAPDRLTIAVVAKEGFSEDTRLRIEEAIRDHGDAAFSIDWQRVEAIPHGPSGKFHFTISEIRDS